MAFDFAALNARSGGGYSTTTGFTGPVDFMTYGQLTKRTYTGAQDDNDPQPKKKKKVQEPVSLISAVAPEIIAQRATPTYVDLPIRKRRRTSGGAGRRSLINLA